MQRSLVALVLVGASGIFAAPMPPGDKLPQGVCATLTVERAKYGTPISYDNLGKVMNATAWAHRGIGLGLAGKSGGTTCKIPGGKTIACDYLMRQSDNVGWDVIGDVEGPASVQCNASGVTMSSNRPWTAPVDPGTSPPPATDLTKRVEALEKQMTAANTAIADLQRVTTDHGQQLVALRSQVQALNDRVLKLEQTPPGASCTVQEVSTSTTWAHAHRVQTCLPASK